MKRVDASFKKFLRLSLITSLIVPLSVLVACGGGSSGDGGQTVAASDGVRFSGSVSDLTPVEQATRRLEGIEVCGLGSCDTTDTEGTWDFTVPLSSYQGGDVLFTLMGGAVDGSTTVQGLDPDADAVLIEFLVNADSSISVTALDQAIPDASGMMQSADACELIESNNIVILEARDGLTTTNSLDSCPESLPAFAIIANPGDVAFEYGFFIDIFGFEFTGDTGVLMPGESVVVDATYLCENEESVETLVTARILNYLPENSSVISVADARSSCGQGDDFGNVIATRPFVLEVIQ